MIISHHKQVIGSIWYKKTGLQFTCTKCSACCRHDPGYVFLSYNDLKLISAGCKLSEKEFLDIYCIEVNINGFKRISLKEKKNFDCIFWETGGCSIYGFRPFQCRSYPFWSVYVESEESWKQLSHSCPGVNQGKKHTAEEIGKWLKKRLDEPYIIL